MSRFSRVHTAQRASTAFFGVTVTNYDVGIIGYSSNNLCFGLGDNFFSSLNA